MYSTCHKRHTHSTHARAHLDDMQPYAYLPLLEVTAMNVHLGTFSDGMAEVFSSSAARCDILILSETTLFSK